MSPYKEIHVGLKTIAFITNVPPLGSPECWETGVSLSEGGPDRNRNVGLHLGFSRKGLRMEPLHIFER